MPSHRQRHACIFSTTGTLLIAGGIDHDAHVGLEDATAESALVAGQSTTVDPFGGMLGGPWGLHAAKDREEDSGDNGGHSDHDKPTPVHVEQWIDGHTATHFRRKGKVTPWRRPGDPTTVPMHVGAAAAAAAAAPPPPIFGGGGGSRVAPSGRRRRPSTAPAKH